MKRDQIQVKGRYYAKVNGRVVAVEIICDNGYRWNAFAKREEHRGWQARNLATGREVTIRSAQRLRGEVPAEPASNVQRREETQAAFGL